MVPTVKLQSKLEQHFRYLGYDGKEIIGLFLKWNKCNGPSWTVDRIKTIKTQFIHIMSDQSIDRSWISYRGNTPKGVLGPLFRYGLDNRRQRKVTLSILNSYLVFIGKNVKKMHDTLENIAKPINTEQTVASKQLFLRDGEYFSIKLLSKLRRAVSKVAYYDSVPFKTNVGSHSGNPFGQTWTESLDATRDCILPTEILSGHYVQKKRVYHPPETVGELVPLYERGDKVRVVAMPYAEVQLWLEPLHVALNAALRCIVEDCTFDQVKGIEFAQQKLRDGLMVHSVDLSAATDRFPFVFQERVLRTLFPDPDMVNWGSILNRLVDSFWSSPVGNIKYGAGQPMGTYGSFALFALSHHALLHSLCSWYGVPREPDGSYPYRILGDDIVITNTVLYERYRSKLDNIGVSVSSSKSINSTLTAEFAGYLADKQGYYKPVKPSKYRLTNEKIKQYITCTGKNHFSGSNGEVGELLMYLPSPMGCGLNPMGQSWSTRMFLYGYIPVDLDDQMRSGIPVEDILGTLNAQLWLSYKENLSPDRDISLSWINFVNRDNTISLLLEAQTKSRPEILSANVQLGSNLLMNLGNQSQRKLAIDGLKHSDLHSRDLLLKGAYYEDAEMHQEDYLKFYKSSFPLFPWK